MAGTSLLALIDDIATHRQQDITITAFEDCVTLEQIGPDGETVHKITLSPAQLADLTAALNLPEGVYTREAPD